MYLIYPAVIALSSNFTDDAATVSKSTTERLNIGAGRDNHVRDVLTKTTNAPMKFENRRIEITYLSTSLSLKQQSTEIT